MRRNNIGERGSPWKVPLKTLMRRVYPWGVWNVVCSPLSRLVTMKMKSLGMPRNLRVSAICVWSGYGKACVKSRYAIRMSLS